MNEERSLRDADVSAYNPLGNGEASVIRSALGVLTNDIAPARYLGFRTTLIRASWMVHNDIM